MKGRVDLRVGLEELIEQASTAMALPSHTTGNAGQPDLERAADGIREEDRRVVLARGPDQARHFAGRGFRRDFEHRIDLRHLVPERGEFPLGQHGEVQVGTPRLDGADGGSGHAGVAEPVRRAQEQAEGVESLGIGRLREVDAAFGIGDQEIGMGDFPAVVNPEPVGRGAVNLPFQQMVQIHGDFPDSASLGRDRFAGVNDPTRHADGPDAHHGEQGTRPLGQTGRERRGGGKLPEERGPDPRVARMLVDQDAEHAAFPKQGGSPLHLLLLVKGLHASGAAVAVDQIVELSVMDRLVDASGLARFHELGDLGVDLPVAEVTEGGDGAPLPGFFPDDPVFPGLLVVKAEAGSEFFSLRAGILTEQRRFAPRLAKWARTREAAFRLPSPSPKAMRRFRLARRR